MKKSHVEHILSAASKICEDNEFIIIGSQSLHGKYPDLADEILMSQEVDIIAKNKSGNTEFLNVIGIDSPFHVEFGYYADPVEVSTATLPKKWKNRLVHMKLDRDDTGIKAYCIEPHDLTVAKLAAGREKDHIFIRALLERGLLDPAPVAKRIAETSVSAQAQKQMASLFARLVATSARGPAPEIKR